MSEITKKRGPVPIYRWKKDRYEEYQTERDEPTKVSLGVNVAFNNVFLSSL